MSAETRGLVITADGLEFCHGVFNELARPGRSLSDIVKPSWRIMEVVTKQRISQLASALVTDAKDLYDTLSRDTSSIPEQRAFIFELVGLREWLVKYSAGIK